MIHCLAKRGEISLLRCLLFQSIFTWCGKFLLLVLDKFVTSHAHPTHTQRKRQFEMILILLNCLIDTIYFTVSAFHLPVPLSTVCQGYVLLLTHSIIPQTFEYVEHILNIHLEELLTWLEKVSLLSPFFAYFFPSVSQILPILSVTNLFSIIFLLCPAEQKYLWLIPMSCYHQSRFKPTDQRMLEWIEENSLKTFERTQDWRKNSDWTCCIGSGHLCRAEWRYEVKNSRKLASRRKKIPMFH